MRFAVVSWHSGPLNFFNGLRDHLRARGHEVRYFCHLAKSKTDVTRMRWADFDFGPLEKFKPDKVLCFNGFAQGTAGAASKLRMHFETWTLELGWLPQKSMVYLDPRGHNGRSELSYTDLGEGSMPEDAEIFEKLKARYKPGAKPHGIPDEYLLVPLQLEKDTAIRLDSHYFKSMDELVRFACASFPDKKIVVKCHPKGEPVDVPRGVKRIVKEADMNTLAFHAKWILGINSTSLIEALVHMKPIAALGRTVVSSSSVWLSPEDTLETPRRLLDFKPDPVRVKRTLAALFKTQFHCAHPPKHLLDALTKEKP